MLTIYFPLENMHTLGGAGCRSAVLSRMMLTLGHCCSSEYNGVPKAVGKDHFVLRR